MDILTRLRNGVRLPDPASTTGWGRRVGGWIAPGSVLALHGDLGAGKTTLAKGIAEGWGVKETVKSPSFNYFLPYRAERGLFVHLDAYRIDSPEEYDSLLIEEILEEPWLLVAEWAERIVDRLPPDAIHLFLSEGTGTGRHLQIRPAASGNQTPPA